MGYSFRHDLFHFLWPEFAAALGAILVKVWAPSSLTPMWAKNWGWAYIQQTVKVYLCFRVLFQKYILSCLAWVISNPYWQDFNLLVGGTAISITKQTGIIVTKDRTFRTTRVRWTQPFPFLNKLNSVHYIFSFTIRIIASIVEIAPL